MTWRWNPEISKSVPIDLNSQEALPDCSGAAAMDSFVSDQHLYLIVAVFHDRDRGGYDAPSLFYEITADNLQPGIMMVSKLQSITTTAANDVHICNLDYAGLALLTWLAVSQ